MVERLSDTPGMTSEEKETYRFILTSYPQGDLGPMLYPMVRDHIMGRYQWFFQADGQLRKPK